MADLHKVGGRTPQAVIYKSESHKLHQAFPVKSGDTIVQGQPVKLNDDGTISPYTGQLVICISVLLLTTVNILHILQMQLV